MSNLGQLTCKLDGTVIQVSGDLRTGGEEIAAQFVAMLQDAAVVMGEENGGLKRLSVVFEGAQYSAVMAGSDEIEVTKEKRAVKRGSQTE
mmetsp:Transcript_24972/g.57596  ORF Transcript_24972/g.57596 Transcript_24972/m.57596 type:complete len:90 (+) Transcript_24972:41-310(+)